MSAVYFPLRASVELFSDPQSPVALTRVKEAAVLYDRLIVEDGLYDATFTEGVGAVMPMWTPGDYLTHERLEDARRPVPVGEEVSFAIGKQEMRGEPAKELREVHRGVVSTRFVAHFHDVIEELRRLDVDWMRVVRLGPNDYPATSDLVREAIRELNFEAFRHQHDLPGVDPSLRRWVYASFNRDSVIAADLGAAFNVSPLFRPVVERGGVQPDFPGDEALSILVPDLGALPWEAIAEFRDHPGSREARAKLREFEERAAVQEPGDAYHFLKQVSREVNAGYIAAVKEYAPRLTDELGLELMKTLVSVSTVVGPYIEKIASLAVAAGEARRFQRSWIAALMKLHDHTG
jgi:hypothetical protein